MSANGVSGPHGSDMTGWPASSPQVIDVDHIGFVDVLRAVNPLQYVPVVGTIYRLATGESAPSAARAGVSVLAGLLTGGPIGLLGSIAGALAEHFLHVEDRLAQALGTAPAAEAAPIAEAGAPAPVAATAAAAYRSAANLGAA